MKKIKLPGKGFILNKVLRALQEYSGLELPFSVQEEKPSGVSPFHSYYTHMEYRNAMLEAEILKAKAELEYRRRNSIY